MTDETIPNIPLLDGTSIPQLGFGTYQIEADDAERAVLEALELGYRHIDTARIYGNEEGVGRALAASGIPRDELYVTTKLWNDDQGAGRASEVLDASLERLGLDYVDLYLIHWPVPTVDQYVATWADFPALRESGRTRSIGVCNFHDDHLERLISETGEVPVVNQIEVHPLYVREELRAHCAERGIVVEAWSPIARAAAALFDQPVLAEIAAKHGRTIAQVVLRWHLQLGNVIFPKTNSVERMRENLDLFGFELGADELAAISALDRGDAGRVGPSSLTFGAPRD